MPRHRQWCRENEECGVLTYPKQQLAGRFESVPFQGLVASTEGAARAVAPMINGATRANLEMFSLAGRRAKAYLELPNVLAQCRGPQDIFAAQALFWQSMVRDYAECSQRMVTALRDAGSDATAAAGTNGKRERDTLTFPNVFGFPAWQLPVSDVRQRDEEDRAA
jgi:hypothetical protein